MGEYVQVDAPRSSVLRLVEGVGMPFAEYRQTIEVTADGGRTAVMLRLEYGVRGPLVLIERFTFRGKLDHALQDSVHKVEMRFA